MINKPGGHNGRVHIIKEKAYYGFSVNKANVSNVLWSISLPKLPLLERSSKYLVWLFQRRLLCLLLLGFPLLLISVLLYLIQTSGLKTDSETCRTHCEALWDKLAIFDCVNKKDYNKLAKLHQVRLAYAKSLKYSFLLNIVFPLLKVLSPDT